MALGWPVLVEMLIVVLVTGFIRKKVLDNTELLDVLKKHSTDLKGRTPEAMDAIAAKLSAKKSVA